MTTYERPFGRYFEDFEPGDVYKHWPGKTITEYDDHLFCMITMNHHPLHTDAWYAETQTQFGKNVVVGNLVYSLVLGMSVPDVSGAAIANLEVEDAASTRCRRSTATRSTPRRRCSRSGSRRASPTGASSRSRRVGFNQRGEEVCYFRRKVMVPCATRRAAERPYRRPSSRVDDGGRARARVGPGADPDCLFCRIVAGEVPATIVSSTEHTVAFLDHRPLFEGHTLVVPRPHVATLRDLPPTLLGPVLHRGAAAGGRRAGRPRRRRQLRGRQQRGQPERAPPPLPRRAAPAQGRAAGVLLAPDPLRRTPSAWRQVAAAVRHALQEP